MLKRTRNDGHLSKEDYDLDDQGDSVPVSLAASRATPSTMAARKFITVPRKDKKEQLGKHLYILNKAFANWFKKAATEDIYGDFTNGFQDYVDYVQSLEDRYLRRYGEVLTFGSGDCGQLAHGIEEDNDLTVAFPRVVLSLRDKKVCGIACGGIHNAVYTESGQVYTWGCGDDGPLGRPGPEDMPLLVEGLAGETIIRVACGDAQTIAVSTKGEVWGWGCYKDKEGKKWFNPSPTAANPAKDIKKQQNDPMRISGLSNIVDVACGASFNLAKSADGQVYSWGIGECGELGRFAPALKVDNGEEAVYDLPNILKHHITPGHMYLRLTNDDANSGLTLNNDNTRQPVKDVKVFGCGAYHSMLAAVGDKVFCCGLNNYGQLGTGNTTNSYYMIEIPALENRGIVSMKGGMHHSLVLTAFGAVYAFGRGDSSQLGCQDVNMGKAGDYSVIPVQTTFPTGTNIVSIECGGNHNLVLTEKNEVYTWGYGDMMALGHGKDQDESLPKKINFAPAKIKKITITQVAGGGQHSAIIGEVTST